jgi:hypothetical protein
LTPTRQIQGSIVAHRRASATIMNRAPDDPMRRANFIYVGEIAGWIF